MTYTGVSVIQRANREETAAAAWRRPRKRREEEQLFESVLPAGINHRPARLAIFPYRYALLSPPCILARVSIAGFYARRWLTSPYRYGARVCVCVYFLIRRMRRFMGESRSLFTGRTFLRSARLLCLALYSSSPGGRENLGDDGNALLLNLLIHDGERVYGDVIRF